MYAVEASTERTTFCMQQRQPQGGNQVCGTGKHRGQQVVCSRRTNVRTAVCIQDRQARRGQQGGTWCSGDGGQQLEAWGCLDDLSPLRQVQLSGAEQGHQCCQNLRWSQVEVLYQQPLALCYSLHAAQQIRQQLVPILVADYHRVTWGSKCLVGKDLIRDADLDFLAKPCIILLKQPKKHIALRRNSLAEAWPMQSSEAVSCDLWMPCREEPCLGTDFT